MHIKRFYPHAGVTLIEMLLVISVIALIALIGVGLAKQQTEEAKMRIAVLQLQGLATAATHYFESLQTDWPTAIDELVTFFPPSLIQNSLNNPWGAPLTLAPKHAKPFYVATEVVDVATAKRIQQQLPIATYQLVPETLHYQVRLYLTPPSQISWLGAQLGAKLKSIDTISMTNNRDYNVPRINCDASQSAKWVAGMTSFAKRYPEQDGEFVSGVSLCSNQSTSAQCTGDNKPIFSDQLRLRMTGWTGNYDVKAVVLLMQYCDNIS